VIKWPNATRKEAIKHTIAEKHGFQDAIASRPNWQDEGYFNRKRCYSIQCMIINDNNYRILHILSGASHDTQVFINSNIWLKHSTYFSRREYLLANTNYPLTRITMAPYKKLATNDN
jgi:hypothetical protein